MDRRSIVLKSISCRGVKSFNLFQKPSAYAVVSIAVRNDGRLKQKQKQKTSADHEGGKNPEWDQTIQFDFDDSDFQDLFLEFAIMAQGNLLLFGDKLMGKSRVPITDLSVGRPSDAFSHVSYQVQSPDGKPNGVLSFSYSLNLPEMEIRLPPPLDHGIPSEPPMDDYTPPPAQPTKILYPPPPLPEAETEDCFSHVSYQVQSPDGKPNGFLSFSYSLNLPKMEIRLPTPLDHGIPSEPQMDDYSPPPAQPAKSLYPPIQLPEAEPENCFNHVSYQVQSPEGKPNGVPSFSYSLNLPKTVIRLPPPLDHGIPSEPQMDDYTPPPVPPTKSLYPPIQLPEAEPEDCFCYYNQPPPPDPPEYYYPPPPPPPASGYYPAFDRAVSSPVLNRDAYLPVPVTANAGYYTPPTASIPPPMPDFGAYYRSSAPSYPPSQGSCSYCNYCN